MKAVEQKILSEGKAINEDILVVDSFLNHQIDPQLMKECGDDFARHFADRNITRVVTVESSGIAPAVMTALALGCPLVFMKKGASATISSEALHTKVHSFTKNKDYELFLKKCYINEDDNVLLIDDFLANGAASFGMAKLIEEAGAKVAGIGIVVNKAFQPGEEALKKAGYDVYCLANVIEMGKDHIVFRED